MAPFCGAIGLVGGAFVPLMLADSAPLLCSQATVSLLAALFLAVCNAVPDSTSSPRILGLVCGTIGAFAGYGAGATVRLLSMPSAPTSWADGPWRDDLGSELRLPLFLFLVMIFHAVEFAFAVAHHPQDATFRAFLLAPVPAGGYSIAMILALVEFWAEMPLGRWRLLSGSAGLAELAVAFAVSLFGWAFRASALFTARSNFTHLVATSKANSHRLVIHGVYRLCRHPGYVGWFLWSVSTQLVLGNPICLALYAFVAWKFFASRIPGEEHYLVSFFGEEYREYARAVPCGLPGISNL